MDKKVYTVGLRVVSEALNLDAMINVLHQAGFDVTAAYFPGKIVSATGGTKLGDTIKLKHSFERHVGAIVKEAGNSAIYSIDNITVPAGLVGTVVAVDALTVKAQFNCNIMVEATNQYGAPTVAPYYIDCLDVRLDQYDCI